MVVLCSSSSLLGLLLRSEKDKIYVIKTVERESSVVFLCDSLYQSIYIYRPIGPIMERRREERR